MKKPTVKFQIGKKGLTKNFIDVLKTAFSTRKSITVVILKNLGHKKENIKEIAEKIVGSLGKNYVYKIVGFTIFLKKFRKNIRK